MASDNEEALCGHVTQVGSNHWTVTVSHGTLLAYNSIMAPINTSQEALPSARFDTFEELLPGEGTGWRGRLGGHPATGRVPRLSLNDVQNDPTNPPSEVHD